MWSPTAVAAILLAVAPSSALCAGFESRRSSQFAPMDNARKYCMSFAKGGSRPYTATFCVPGMTFKVDCNICLCRQSGTSAICTKRDCYLELQDSECEVGSTTSVECNVCICSPEGKWACTEKDCTPGVHYVDCDKVPKEHRDADSSPQACVPGSSFLNGCDRCYCLSDGVSVVCKSRPCNGVTGSLLQFQVTNLPADGIPALTGNVIINNQIHFCFILKIYVLCIDLPHAQAIVGDIIGDIAGNINVPGSSVFLNRTHACFATFGIDICFDIKPLLGLLAQLLPVIIPANEGKYVPDFHNETHVCVTRFDTAICVDQVHLRGMSFHLQMLNTTGSGRRIRRHSPYDRLNMTLPPLSRNETQVCTIYNGKLFCYEPLPAAAPLRRHDGTDTACTPTSCGNKRSTREVSCTPGTTYKEQCNVCFCLQDGKSGGCTRRACPPGTY